MEHNYGLDAQAVLARGEHLESFERTALEGLALSFPRGIPDHQQLYVLHVFLNLDWPNVWSWRPLAKLVSLMSGKEYASHLNDCLRAETGTDLESSVVAETFELLRRNGAFDADAIYCRRE